MFTGLIQDIGTVTAIDKSGDWRIEIATGLDLSKVAIGASVACSGCCLTVIEKSESVFAVQVSAESLMRTVIHSWDIGTRVNLEPSLKLGDELGGHFVFGHVDGVAELVEIKPEGDSHRLTIRPPQDLMMFVASKGTVALDGVSLTVNEVGEDTFGVNIIPHTWVHTALVDRRAGDHLNIEIDMLARYVARMMR